MHRNDLERTVRSYSARAQRSIGESPSDVYRIAKSIDGYPEHPYTYLHFGCRAGCRLDTPHKCTFMAGKAIATSSRYEPVSLHNPRLG